MLARGFYPRIPPVRLGDDPALEREHPVGGGGYFRVMGDHDDRDSVALEFLERPDRVRRVRPVKRPGGLVSENHSGAAGDGTRQGDALSLSAGELSAERPGPTAEPEAPERGRGSARTQSPGHAAHAQPERRVCRGARVGQEVGVLKHETNLCGPQAVPGSLVQGGRVVSEQAVTAGARPVEEAQDVEQCRLSGAGRANDRHELSRVHGQGHPAEGLDAVGACVAPGEVADLDQGLVGRARGELTRHTAPSPRAGDRPGRVGSSRRPGR